MLELFGIVLHQNHSPKYAWPLRWTEMAGFPLAELDWFEHFSPGSSPSTATCFKGNCRGQICQFFHPEPQLDCLGSTGFTTLSAASRIGPVTCWDVLGLSIILDAFRRN
eukprot:s1976_g2.t1